MNQITQIWRKAADNAAAASIHSVCHKTGTWNFVTNATYENRLDQSNVITVAACASLANQ